MSDALALAQAAAAALVGQPAVQPVLTVAEVKANLKIDGDAEDGLIAVWIAAAQDAVERFTGQILSPREVIETVDRFGAWIDLATWPVREITSIEYTDRGGAEQLLPSTGYLTSLVRRPVRLIASGSWPNTVPRPGAITIIVQAGYASPDEVPPSLKQAMQLMVAHWYRNRDATDEHPAAVAMLCRPYRLVTC